jgi:hypothetical protein
MKWHRNLGRVQSEFDRIFRPILPMQIVAAVRRNALDDVRARKVFNDVTQPFVAIGNDRTRARLSNLKD